MDKKDSLILAALLNDARSPNTKLAKHVKVSREVLSYRLKKLEKSIIKQYSTQINIQALGYQRTSCYITLQNCSLAQEQTIINEIINHHFISAISTNIGLYDIIFDIFYQDQQQLEIIIQEIKTLLKDNQKEFFILPAGTKHEIFYQKLFHERTGYQRKKQNTNAKLDKIDLIILKTLTSNARTPIVEIASKTKLKANAISYRIKRLEREGIIIGSTIFIDFEVLGLDIYNLQLKTEDIKENKELLKYLKQHDQVFYYYEHLGNKEWNLDVGIAIRRKQELKEVIRGLKENHGSNTTLKQIYLIERIHKEMTPKGLFQIT